MSKIKDIKKMEEITKIISSFLTVKEYVKAEKGELTYNFTQSTPGLSSFF